MSPHPFPYLIPLSPSFPSLATNANTTSPQTPFLALSPHQAQVAVIGAVIIECLTILAAVYLLIPLSKQGFGKLRVKMLFGMVFSDLMLGLVGIVPNVAFLAGNRLEAGTAACDASGFLLTTVLFTQHLWTLALATATFFILKRPLSIWTRHMQAYWWTIPTTIWGISLLQAGLWYRYNGMGVSTSGALCYYGPGKHKLDRDLVQFVPRAFVFAVVIFLYSGLFKFLRRPDIVHAATSMDDAGESPSMLQSAIMSRRGTDPALTLNDPQPDTDPRLSRLNPETPSGKDEKVRKGSSGSGLWPTPIKMKDLGGKASVPPWEQLHLNKVDLPDEPPILPPALAASWRERQESKTSTLVGSSGYPRTGSWAASSRRPSQGAEGTPSHDSMGRSNSLAALPSLPLPHQHSKTRLIGRQRTSSSSSIESAGSSPRESPGELVPPFTYHDQPDARMLSLESQDEEISRKGTETQFLNRAGRRGSDESGEGTDSEDERDGSGAETRGQTLQEFFAQHQATFVEIDEKEPRNGVRSIAQRRGSIGKNISAASYFNRQASLLMLYFPIAYVVLFSFSLVRLLYDMITFKNSPPLTILSLWFTLSVGLVDGLVYGLAEYIVRRRVRRKMPSSFRPIDPTETAMER